MKAPIPPPRMVAWVFLILALGAFAWTAFHWLSYCSPLAAARFAFSGAWFKEQFNPGHAGTALDQPTIGKFLLWPSAMAYLACTLILPLRGVVNPDRRAAWRWMSLGVTLLIVLVLTEFLAPTFLLVQYVISMGLTVYRFLGLGLCCGIWILLPAVVFRAWKADLTSTSWAQSPLPWALAFSLVVPTYYSIGVLYPSSWRHWTGLHTAFLAWLVLIAPMPCIYAFIGRMGTKNPELRVNLPCPPQGNGVTPL